LIRGAQGPLRRSQLREPPTVGVEADRSQRRPEIDAGEKVERVEMGGQLARRLADEQPLFTGPGLDHRGRTREAVTPRMKEIFIGGRGFGLGYLWNAIKPTTKWNDPENDIVISPG
jgi:hypothetical protein